MTLLEMLVGMLVKVLRLVHLMTVKFYKNPLKIIISKKLKRIGLNVVESPGTVCNIEEKEKSHYETSKVPGVKPTMTIYNDKFFERLAYDRGLGVGESYVEGWWDCDQLDELSEYFFREKMPEYMKYPFEKFIFFLEYEFFNKQTSDKAYEVAEGHYDLGDNLFESFLDPSMTYTCAYWRNAKNLAEAQQHKLDLVARKLKLKPGMRVLELGCGWGGLAQFLAEKYQVSVVACNIAKEGAKAAAERCKGLQVEVRNCDYREIDEKFDRVVAVGLMEHVGPHNYKTFMQLAHRCLDDHGIFLIHTIGMDDDNLMRDEPWTNKHIFPNGALPRATEVTKALSGMFTLEDWQNFGNDYSKTLMCWYENFIKSWPSIKYEFKDSSRFYRIWTYYLLMAAGSFRARNFQLWQIVLTKNGLPGGYDSIR